MNGVGVELADDPRLGLVLAEAEHAQALDEHDRGAGVAQGGRIGRGEPVIVVAVLLAVFSQRNVDLLLQRGQVCVRRPGNKQRTDFGADEVVGATGAEEGQILARGRSSRTAARRARR